MDVFTAGENTPIEVEVDDVDGVVIKVEYFFGWHKQGESTTPPFTFV